MGSIIPILRTHLKETYRAPSSYHGHFVSLLSRLKEAIWYSFLRTFCKGLLDSDKNFVLNLRQLHFGNLNRQKSNESRQGDAEVSFAQLSLPDSGNKAPSIFVFDEEEKYEQNQQHPHKIFSA